MGRAREFPTITFAPDNLPSEIWRVRSGYDAEGDDLWSYFTTEFEANQRAAFINRTNGGAFDPVVISGFISWGD
jgi:hypothetical protein